MGDALLPRRSRRRRRHGGGQCGASPRLAVARDRRRPAPGGSSSRAARSARSPRTSTRRRGDGGSPPASPSSKPKRSVWTRRPSASRSPRRPGARVAMFRGGAPRRGTRLRRHVITPPRARLARCGRHRSRSARAARSRGLRSHPGRRSSRARTTSTRSPRSHRSTAAVPARPDADVPGDGSSFIAGLDGADLLISRHGGDGKWAFCLTDDRVARREIRRERAAREPDVDITRRGLDVALSADLLDAHVAACGRRPEATDDGEGQAPTRSSPRRRRAHPTP